MPPVSQWRWRYSPWLGVTWGPIPVALLTLIIGGVVVFFLYYAE